MASYNVVSTTALIEKFNQALSEGWGYIWGRAGVLWTAQLQAELEKTTDPDREMGRKYGKKWIGHKVADCSGLFSWAFKQLGSYMYHGSNTMWNKYCVSQGELKNGKRADGKELKPGTAVFTYNKSRNNRGHVGLYVGDGYVIEAEGTKAGVIKSKITNKKWVEWGELKNVDYGGTYKPSEPVKKSTSSTSTKIYYPTLRRGAKGDLVAQLQTLLSKDGSSLVIDGIFGCGTQSAVKAFQRRHGLVADGIVGAKTWGELLKLIH